MFVSRLKHATPSIKCKCLQVDALTQPRNAGSLFCRGASSARGVICGSAAAVTATAKRLLMAINFMLAFWQLELMMTTVGKRFELATKRGCVGIYRRIKSGEMNKAPPWLGIGFARADRLLLLGSDEEWRVGDTNTETVYIYCILRGRLTCEHQLLQQPSTAKTHVPCSTEFPPYQSTVRALFRMIEERLEQPKYLLVPWP